jgi:hypothetical protein
MTNVNITKEQEQKIIEAVRYAHGSKFGNADQNNYCQKTGQIEGVKFVLEVLGIEIDELKKY